jgi:hypothetical protein
MTLTLKRIILNITLIVILAVNVISGYGQGISFGARVTPSVVPSVAVKNPSPSNVYGRSDFNINFGIYAFKSFNSSPWGIKAGLEYGAVPFFVGFDAPRNAFGTGGGGDEQINTSFRTNNFGYAALVVSPTFKLLVKGRYLEFTAGPSIRFYNYPKNGFSELGFAFNRAVPYDENDPAAGPPDLRVRVTDLDLFYFSLPVSVDYAIRSGPRSQMKFGIMHNISKPLRGELEVQMYGKMYGGSFKPRTGFWGINLQYERLSKNASLSYEKRSPDRNVEGGIRKSLFVETYTKSRFLTATFDMRVAKNRNDGFGITGGAGIGNEYLSDATTDNISPYKRMLALPIGINYIVGRKSHGLEVGAGITPQIPLQHVRNGIRYSGTLYTSRIGYRFQPVNEGFIGRLAWNPVMEHIPVFSGHRLTLGNVAISAGYSFQ